MTDKQGQRIDNELAPLGRQTPEGEADMIGCDQIQHQVATLLDNLPDEDQHADIRRLNDAARAAIGLTTRLNLSEGFAALAERDRQAVIRTVRDYSQWTGSGSIDADHDFGIIYKLANGAWTQATPGSGEIVQIVVWSIDCLDHHSQGPCPRPWDPMAGERVITLMLATEY